METDAERVIVNKAARAIYEARNGKGCVPWSRIGGGHQGPYRADARAALATVAPLDQLAGLVAGTHVIAPAEPTKAMMTAWWRVHFAETWDDSSDAAAYTAMLAARPQQEGDRDA